MCWLMCDHFKRARERVCVYIYIYIYIGNRFWNKLYVAWIARMEIMFSIQKGILLLLLINRSSLSTYVW
jgi:hypothetical protein